MNKEQAVKMLVDIAIRTEEDEVHNPAGFTAEELLVALGTGLQASQVRAVMSMYVDAVVMVEEAKR